jgi:1-acyl-sn-glycerol-3-phosphate acyltransferase
VLVQPVIVGLAVLVPDVTERRTGVVCLVITLGGYFVVHRIWWRARIAARERPRREFATRTTLLEIATIPPIIGSIVLVAGHTGGLDWLAFGAAAAIVVGIADAWILLIEILR